MVSDSVDAGMELDDDAPYIDVDVMVLLFTATNVDLPLLLLSALHSWKIH